MEKEWPSRPCRVCLKPTPAYKRKDGRGFTYRRQCEKCRYVIRDDAGWRKSLSNARLGDKNPKWVPVGTKCLTNCNGYTYFKIKCADGKWRYEHRVVAQESHPKNLTTKDDVHHINENTLDNRPENLEVISRINHRLKHRKHRKNR